VKRPGRFRVTVVADAIRASRVYCATGPL